MLTHQDIKHVFQEFVQGHTTFQRLLASMEPSMTALGMPLLVHFTAEPNSLKFQNVKLANKLTRLQKYLYFIDHVTPMDINPSSSL